MVVILRVATICSALQGILPLDIEDAIMKGRRNLKRFSKSIPEFEWHSKELENLDTTAATGMSMEIPRC